MNKKNEEYSSMKSPIKVIYQQLFTSPDSQSPPLSKKLESIKESPIPATPDNNSSKSFTKTEDIVLQQRELIKKANEEIAYLRIELKRVSVFRIERFLGELGNQRTSSFTLDCLTTYHSWLCVISWILHAIKLTLYTTL